MKEKSKYRKAVRRVGQWPAFQKDSALPDAGSEHAWGLIVALAELTMPGVSTLSVGKVLD